MPDIELRGYQSEIVRAVGQALRRVRRVVVVLPPGGGKTVIAAFIAQRFAGRGDATYFNCHRSELLKQTSGTFSDCGLAHGFVASGYPMNRAAMVQVCSVDSLKSRLAQLREPRVCIWDECHHIGAAGWSAIMEAWPNAVHIGLTGTPWRLDGTGLGLYFDEMVLGPGAAELIEMGSLSQYKIFAPSAPDMQGVGKMAGEFKKGETADRMRAPKLTGDIINHWRRTADGLRTVGYGVNVAHSQYLAAMFNQAGIPAAHLDGGSMSADRKRDIQAFADGGIRVLFNVGLFGEGFDLSAWAGRPVTIDAAILADPTQSLTKYLQESMRCMRPSPGKIAIINDHAGNSARHGFPDDVREWDLQGRDKKAGAKDGPPPPYTCKCFQQIRRPLPPKCPHCGIALAVEVKPVDVADAELVEVTEREKQETRARLKREQAEAKSLDELVNLGRKRGHKYPMKWAQHVLGNRRPENHEA